MSARHRWSLFAVCILGVSLLSGCVTTLAPVRVLPGSDNGDIVDVKVAVQANGIKHYLVQACAERCRLVYQRVQLAAPIYQYVFDGAELRSPALAATDDGHGVVAFTECAPSCIDRYTIIPPNATPSTPIITEALALPGAISGGEIQLAARGNVVYASYYADGSPYSRLRYRQLSGGSSSGVIDARPLVSASNPSLAIGGDGALYAVWKASSDDTIEIAYGSNSGSSGDFAPPASYEPRPDDSFRDADIALDPSNTAYLVYAYDDGENDLVKLRCVASSGTCFGGVVDRVIPLDSAQNPWRLRGAPQIQVLGSSPAVVFAADTSSTDKEEIWYYTPPSYGVDPGPRRVTSDSVGDDEPLIVVERSSYGDVPVVAWRSYETVAPTIDCPRDAFVFYFASSTTRRVFESNGGCATKSRDLAANGPWVAGVWIDRRTRQHNSPLAAWTLFNADMLYVPFVATQP
jgi:hypothetical protein